MTSRTSIDETIRRFAADRSGATAIEYGLLLTLIALAIVFAVNAVGGKIAAIFDSITAFFTQ